MMRITKFYYNSYCYSNFIFYIQFNNEMPITNIEEIISIEYEYKTFYIIYSNYIDVFKYAYWQKEFHIKEIENIAKNIFNSNILIRRI